MGEASTRSRSRAAILANEPRCIYCANTPATLEHMPRRKRRRVWGRDGLIATPFVQINAAGPLAKAYLTVFAAKLGMALYREHMGYGLPLTGAVYTKYFLNAGLSRTTAEGFLRIMPIDGTLRQGRFQVREQFAYRYNCDEGRRFPANSGRRCF